MRFNRERLIQDIKNIYKPAIVMGIYGILFELLFHKICPSRLIWGVPCPGCGLTRAMTLVMKGEFAEATRMHPFWIAVVVVTVVALAERYLIQDEERYKKINKINEKILFVILMACLIYYGYRMKTMYPNQEPMIYEKDNLRNLFKNIIENIAERITNP